MKYKYNIEHHDLEIDWEDAGPWRGFQLDTYGNTQQELLENITVTAIDEDGGELYTEELSNPISIGMYKEDGVYSYNSLFIDDETLAVCLRVIADYLEGKD